MELKLSTTCLISALIISMTSLSVRAEDLLGIYALAKVNDPTYLARQHQSAASSEVYVQSRAGLLPTIDLSGSYSRTNQDIVSSDNTVFEKGSTTFPTSSYSLSLTQSIYDYSNWARFSQSKEELKRVDAGLVAAEQDLLLRVAERYFAALSAHEDYVAIKSEKNAVGQHLELIKAKRKSGQARKTDLLDSKARYMQTLSREFGLRSRFKDAFEMLRELTGQLPVSLKLLGDFPLVKPEPADPEHWFELAKEFNPEINIRRFALSAATEEVGIRKGGHYPTVDLEMKVGNVDRDGTLFGGGSDIDEGVIALSVNVPLYAGGSVSSRVREAVELQNRAKDELMLEHRAVQRQTFSTYDGVITDVSKVEALRASVEAYQAAVGVKSIGFESGLTNSLTVLDAERDLFFARSEYARARYGYLLNSLRLKRAVGVLSLEDVQQVNSLLSGSEEKISFSAIEKNTL